VRLSERAARGVREILLICCGLVAVDFGIVSQLDEVIERVRRDADALYAFVLTRRGQLVTHGALRDLPRATTDALMVAADTVAGTDRVVTVRLTHRDFAPRAIAEPVECRVGVASERAVVCLVMRGNGDGRRSVAALQVGLRVIEPMLSRVLGTGKPEDGKAPLRRTGSFGKAKSRGSKETPQITVEPARRLGADTMQAIEEEIRKSDPYVPSPHIPRDSLRTTLPYKSTPDGQGPPSSRAKKKT
jgi:hypothetical protein